MGVAAGGVLVAVRRRLIPIEWALVIASRACCVDNAIFLVLENLAEVSLPF